MSIARWISGWARIAPDRVAIYYPRPDRAREITYAELDRRVTGLAGVLANAGVEPADRVALLEYNTPDYIALLFACARLGATLVPLNWRLTPEEHAWQINNCTPKAMIAGDGFLDHCDKLREQTGVVSWLSTGVARDGWHQLNELRTDRVPADVGEPRSAAMLVYTSGTTGFPKGAVLSQSALQWCCINSQLAHDLVSTDTILTDLPLFHVGGTNIQTLPALHSGASVVLHERFDPDLAFDSIEKYRPTVCLGVPPTLNALIGHPRWEQADLSSIRVLMAGSSVVPSGILSAWLDRGVAIGQVYGSTETGPLVISLGAKDAWRKQGSCGLPPIHCDARVLRADDSEADINEPGEIVVRGPNLFSGYWKDAQATAATMHGDWFRTGDIGHVDEDGFFFVDDRKKDVIISGGENIYPAEIENLLSQLDGLSEFAVVARPHERWGEVPVIVAVPEDPEHFDGQTVLDALDGRLARFKMPTDVVVVEALPRNAMGKILKYILRETLEQESQ